MSNYGSGFNGFKSAIEEVTDAFGGLHTWEAVATLFAGNLQRVIQNRRAERYPSYSGVTWTGATDIDFDKARDETFRYLSREREPVVASANWKDAKLEHRGNTIVLTGGGYSIIVAMVASRQEYDRRVGGDITKWCIHVTDDGRRLSNERGYLSSSSPSSTTAKSEAAGHKSLRRIVETFFRVTFVDV